MTKEELIYKADRFAEKHGPSDAYCSMTEIMGNHREITGLKNGFISGYAEALKSQWHDLRKDPNDLPKECENVLCLCSIGARYYSVGHLIKTDNALSWWLNIGSKRLCNVIAWCELPKFKED